MWRAIPVAALLFLLIGCQSPTRVPEPPVPSMPAVPTLPPPPAETTSFAGFALRSETEGWAVSKDSIYRTVDGGSTWEVAYTDTSVSFHQIVPMGEKGLAAVGQKNCAPQPCTGEGALVTSPDGHSWEPVRPEGLESEALHQAWPFFRFVFPTEDVGYLAKSADLAGVGMPIEGLQRSIYRTVDGGHTWQLVELPAESSSTGGLAFVSPEVGFVTIGRGLLRTTDGGQTWQEVLNTDNVPRQAVWRTEDGGQSWVQLYTGSTGAPFDGLWLVSPERTWATTGICTMGADLPCNGPLLFSADGGRSWSQVPGTEQVSRFSPADGAGWYGEGQVGPIRKAEALVTAPLAGASEKEQVMARAAEVVAALQASNLEQLAGLAHPERGVRFSPYAYVNVDADQRFTPEQIRSGLDDPTIYLWGHFDGSGKPMEMTFAAYLRRFERDWLSAPTVSYNQVVMQGNTRVNLTEAYPEGRFVEYHFPGTEANSYIDWGSLRLVFEQQDGVWYLVGVVQDMWTI